MEATGAQRGFIFTVDVGKSHADAERLEHRRMRMRVSQLADPALRRDYSKNIIKKVYETKKTLLSTSAAEEEVTSAYISVAAHELKSVLAVPISIRNKVMGVCYLDNPLSAGVFNDNHVALVEGIMNSAAIALENAGLYEKQKFMSDSFQLYVPKEKIEEVERGIRPALGGATRDVIVGFEDIRDFTAISEKIGAGDTFGLINAYFTFSGDAISAEGGKTNRYLGDARLMIFDPAAPASSVKALQRLRFKLSDFNRMREENIINGRWTYGGKPVIPSINTGLGLDFGSVMAGNVGDPQRMDFTVIGDPVNTAARLESLTKVYRTPILISENVYTLIKNEAASQGILLRKIDQIKVKGKTQPLGIYEVYSYYNDELVELRESHGEMFNEALSCYFCCGSAEECERHWKKAIELFNAINSLCRTKMKPERLLDGQGDYVAYVLSNRLSEMLQNKPAYWDGVYTYKEK
jgi:adenylate cyclase